MMNTLQPIDGALFDCALCQDEIDLVAGGSIVPQLDEYGQPLIPGTFHNGKYVPNLLSIK